MSDLRDPGLPRRGFRSSSVQSTPPIRHVSLIHLCKSNPKIHDLYQSEAEYPRASLKGTNLPVTVYICVSGIKFRTCSQDELHIPLTALIMRQVFHFLSMIHVVSSCP
jgi:hypothetical protein